MRLKFTVFLLALNIIAFGLIAFLGKRAERTDQTMGGLSGQIGREVIEADRIELRGKKLDAPLVIVRNGSAWSISEPMQWSANYFAVNRILNQLQFLEEEASFSVEEIEKTGKSLADYGLDDPLFELMIADGEDTITLSMGTLTEIGNNIYILGPNREDIFVVSREVVGGLLIDLADLRTREIFDIPVFEVEALNLQIKSPASASNGDLKVRLARTNTGWNFEAPLNAEANPELVSNTINTLTAAKVVEFKELGNNDPIIQGLENPLMRVTIQGNKRRQTLLLGNLDPDSPKGSAYFAKLDDNPTVFTVDSKPFDELREAQEALRERNFMVFKKEDLTSINIAENGRQIRLQKIETGKWQVIESSAGNDIQPRRADPVIMQKLISNLHEMRASGFAIDAPNAADLERLGFNQPRRNITLSTGEGTDQALLLAHPEVENEKLYARNNRAEYIYEVDRRATLNMLPLNALHYRNRNLDTLPEAAVITSISLEDLQDGTQIFKNSLGDETALWNNALADLTEKERTNILLILESIRQFNVKSYLKDEYTDDSYQVDSETKIPWQYQVTATISLPGGETQRTDIRTYQFTKRLSGTVQIGGSKLHNSIFEVPQSLLDALYELTDTMQVPPEITGDDVKTPAQIKPVEEPHPTAQPADE
ncbi:MAG: DUF4340 domain-containing protein [Opitutaceae bacterium]